MLTQAGKVMEKEECHYGFAKCKRYDPSYLSFKREIDYLQLRGQFLGTLSCCRQESGPSCRHITLSCSYWAPLSSCHCGTVIRGPAKQGNQRLGLPWNTTLSQDLWPAGKEVAEKSGPGQASPSRARLGLAPVGATCGLTKGSGRWWGGEIRASFQEELGLGASLIFILRWTISPAPSKAKNQNHLLGFTGRRWVNLLC